MATIFYTDSNRPQKSRPSFSIRDTGSMLTRSSSLMLFRKLLVAGLALGSAPVIAGEAPSPGKCLAIAGALLVREGKSWKPLKAKDPIPPGHLIVALPKAELASANGAVHVHLLADVGQRGPFPVLESAVVLNPAKNVDLDLTVDRGIAVLVNAKKSGVAKVKVRVRGEVWDVDLLSPDAKVGIEIYSRHVPHATVYKDDDPTTHVVMLVLEGKVFIDSGREGTALNAPPGPAMLHWDSVGRQSTATNLDKLPPSIKPKDEKEQQILDRIVAATKTLEDGKIGQALDQLLKSDQPGERRVGVTCLGALDKIDQLIGVLSSPLHPDSRDHAILILRHWLGRNPGQMRKLEKVLTQQLGYTPVQTRNFARLLVGFTEQEIRDSGAKALLVELLNNPHLAARELARWHLVRLAPEGKDIVFDAAAPEADRLRAIAQWRKVLGKSQQTEP